MRGARKVSRRVYKIYVNDEDFDFEKTVDIKPKSVVDTFLEKIRARLMRR